MSTASGPHGQQRAPVCLAWRYKTPPSTCVSEAKAPCCKRGQQEWARLPRNRLGESITAMHVQAVQELQFEPENHVKALAQYRAGTRQARLALASKMRCTPRPRRCCVIDDTYTPRPRRRCAFLLALRVHQVGAPALVVNDAVYAQAAGAAHFHWVLGFFKWARLALVVNDAVHAQAAQALRLYLAARSGHHPAARPQRQLRAKVARAARRGRDERCFPLAQRAARDLHAGAVTAAQWQADGRKGFMLIALH